MAGRPRTFDPDTALSKALDLFWAQGYAATNTRDLVKTMGVSWQSLYNTFGNKHDLFLQALRRYDHETLERTRTVLEASDTPLANLQRLVRLWGTHVTTPAFQGCFMNNTVAELGARDEAVASIAQTHFQKFETLLKTALERAVADGSIREDANTEALARFLVGTSQGLIVLGKAGAPAETIDDIVEVAISTLG